MEERTILYISGDGHSGSTLLDIVLGSRNNTFSTGELTFLSQKGIINGEYCSCGKPVPKCDIWTNIINEWHNKRTLKLEEYTQIQKYLTSKKNVISSYKLLNNPTKKISHFLNDTYNLYKIIFDLTESKFIIDSSKTPSRILILKKIGYDVKVIHLVRRFGDVLNSNKKKAKKDLEAGIEHDIEPRKTLYVLIDWLLKNLLTIFFSKNQSYIRIRYEEIVFNPAKYISKIIKPDSEFTEKLKHRGPFYPRHLVAGNIIRMKDHLYIAEKPMNTSYKRLNMLDKFLAKCIDFFY